MPAGTYQPRLLTRQRQMAITDRAEEHSFECSRCRLLPPEIDLGAVPPAPITHDNRTVSATGSVPASSGKTGSTLKTTLGCVTPLPILLGSQAETDDKKRSSAPQLSG